MLDAFIPIILIIVFNILLKVDKIMGNLEDVEAKIDELTAAVGEADSVVEALYEEIKQLTGNGVTDEAAARLNAKLDTLAAALAKVSTDDEEATPSPVE